ncbi:hypothetical protein BDZ91DRAFT_642568, partial [Kalaharituber pfeilii]
ILPATQNGFRPGYRTSDNIMVLRAIAEAATSENKVICAVFADLIKAFDMVDRDILWGQL